MDGLKVIPFIIILCLLLVCSGVTASVHVEYERSSMCDITQECVYKYYAVQYNYGEKEREILSLFTDVNWRCESSGMFGEQQANEYCFTLTNTFVNATAHLNSTPDQSTDNNSVPTNVLTDELDGEFCYVQTSDGKIVSIHYGVADSYEGINIKKSIASTFQANFDSNKEDVEEADAGSIHTSHYSFDRTSGGVTVFSRDIGAKDLIKMADGTSGDSSGYIKHEESVFVNKILQRSHGKMKIKLDFGDLQENDDNSPNDDVDKDFDFGKEFESNGTYLIQKAYCKQRARRSAVFSDLRASSVKRDTILAMIDTSKFEKSRIRGIRDAIPSIPGLLEQLRKNPNNTALADSFKQLLMLEARHGAPSQHVPAINQLIEYYKQIQWSKHPQDVKIRKMIYAFLSADGSTQSQKILGSLLTRPLTEEEQDALLHQLVQLDKAEPDLIDTVISINPSNDDNLLLVLGALARNNNAAIQSKVVKELLRRLNMANSSEAVVFLNYALGNTGSQLAIDALLSGLNHSDVDIQISVIRGLDIHVDQPVVQQALINLLKMSTEDVILEEVLAILNDAFNSKVLQSPSKELMNTLIDTAIKLENANLYELLIQYLKKVGTDKAQEMIDIIIQQYNYGHVTTERVMDDTRIKRGTDWDSNGTYYDLVASYLQRRDDVTTYPTHKAYMWGKKYGISKLNVKVGVGAFVGAYCGGTTNRLKIFGKAATKAHVLGTDYNIAQFEYSDYTADTTLYHKVYVKLGSAVLTNINYTYDLSCRSSQQTLWDTSRTVFDRSVSYFVYIGILRFTIQATASTLGTAGVCMCPSTLTACVNLRPSITLRLTGGGQVDFIGVRGGIEVNTEFQYFMEPNACLQASTGPSCTSASITACLQLHHGYPSYVNIVPWIDFWNLWSGSWHGRIEWEAHRWRITDGRQLLWSSCNPPIEPCSA